MSASIYEQYDRLTDAEVRYLALNPHHAKIIMGSEKLASDETKRIFGRNGRNDKTDAFRHRFWSAILARDLGFLNAKKFTDAHEDFEENPKSEKSMDLHNNSIGLEIGKGGGDNKHLSSICLSALLNNRLFVIRK